MVDLGRRLLRVVRRDLAGLLEAVRPMPRPGLRTYRVGPAGGLRRLHLRIHADGCGLLLIDVADAVHLNSTAATVCWMALEGCPAEETARRLRRRFRTDTTTLARDVAAVYALVDHLATTADACPTCGLTELARVPAFSTPVRAPYKADLALTYACNNACGHCYNERGRRPAPALDLNGWRRVLDRLARVGVPQVIFTGGEPTLFDGLPELIRHAERLGLVAGLNTNGRRLARDGYAQALAAAGLSHVQITLESARPDVHNRMTGAVSFDQTVAGIRAALQAGLYTLTNTTLTRRNAGHAAETVGFLHDLGLRTMAVNGMIHAGAGRHHDDALPEDALAPILVEIRDRAAAHGMRLLWYTPTPYCRLSPVELELGPRRCNAGEYSIAVEPNGDLLPCQSYYRPVGNLLTDPWPSLWNHPRLVRFRRRTTDPRGSGLPPKCWDCPDLALCGGGCGLSWRRAEGPPTRGDWGSPLAACPASHGKGGSR